MTSFVEAFEAVQDFFYGEQALSNANPPHEPEIRHASDPERVVEAAAAGPVAQAFANAELDTQGTGTELGIHGRGNLVPPLHKQLSKQLRKASPGQREDAQDGVLKSLAAGYIGFIAIEPELDLVVTLVSPVRMWNVAVSNFRGTGVRGLGFPEAWVANLERQGEQILATVLRSADLLGRREGKVGLLGRYYAGAGALMRAAQLDHDSFGPEMELNAKAFADKWPYADFAEAS